eukprot:PhM_4_TR3618/c0_g1_i1/m.31322
MSDTEQALLRRAEEAESNLDQAIAFGQSLLDKVKALENQNNALENETRNLQRQMAVLREYIPSHPGNNNDRNLEPETSLNSSTGGLAVSSELEELRRRVHELRDESNTLTLQCNAYQQRASDVADRLEQAEDRAAKSEEYASRLDARLQRYEMECDRLQQQCMLEKNNTLAERAKTAGALEDLEIERSLGVQLREQLSAVRATVAALETRLAQQQLHTPGKGSNASASPGFYGLPKGRPRLSSLSVDDDDGINGRVSMLGDELTSPEQEIQRLRQALALVLAGYPREAMAGGGDPAVDAQSDALNNILRSVGILKEGEQPYRLSGAAPQPATTTSDSATPVREASQQPGAPSAIGVMNASYDTPDAYLVNNTSLVSPGPMGYGDAVLGSMPNDSWLGGTARSTRQPVCQQGGGLGVSFDSPSYTFDAGPLATPAIGANTLRTLIDAVRQLRTSDLTRLRDSVARDVAAATATMTQEMQHGIDAAVRMAVRRQQRQTVAAMSKTVRELRTTLKALQVASHRLRSFTMEELVVGFLAPLKCRFCDVAAENERLVTLLIDAKVKLANDHWYRMVSTDQTTDGAVVGDPEASAMFGAGVTHMYPKHAEPRDGDGDGDSAVRTSPASKNSGRHGKTTPPPSSHKSGGDTAHDDDGPISFFKRFSKK